jgi:8-oxo-dGTP pyrophosphatase MutT (NUDIX family)
VTDDPIFATRQLDPHWLAVLRQAVDAPPSRPRLPLLAGEVQIGSVEADLFERMAVPLLSNGQAVLQQQKSGAWQIRGELDTSLHLLAQALRQAGLAGAWRDELLAVTDASGRRVGAIERGAVRPLGLATQAVHLVGWGPGGPDSGIWVQQRAWDKASEPGLWDTLMGGMVAASDTLHSALERETWEEAGLRLDQVTDLRPGGGVNLRRPSSSGGMAYMVEHIAWFSCNVPAGVVPLNQDGEVQQFRLLQRAELFQKLERYEFTVEAACVLVAALGLDG